MTSWNALLRDQFEWHWEHQLRNRLAGLSDDEYFWEPVEGAWNVRPRGTATTAMAAGGGDFVIDWVFPEPTPAPLTTIAWRLGHVVVGVLGMRNAAHFGRAPVDYASFSYAGTAAEALAQLDREVALWLEGIRALGEDGLDRPCGPAEGPFAEAPLAALVLHINRELIHHLAEVSLLRDLYGHTESRR
ncbi:DinB superfamily protein [Pedococcus cremeus]|uniref:DinB superfamily protein n=1 Tax=Pedococcus cremeus TaxID=587636 RepID=A0A1H9VIB3_9MICO|nr:DinB family protein [Pedococcus cremeus]SES21264.1 DinB superfamily protein [Pedococcus cremeus]